MLFQTTSACLSPPVSTQCLFETGAELVPSVVLAHPPCLMCDSLSSAPATRKMEQSSFGRFLVFLPQLSSPVSFNFPW